MIDKNNGVRRYQYIVFILWLIFTVIAAKYFIFGRLVAFDPSNKLDQDSIAIVNNIKTDLSLQNARLNNTIIHFTSQGCSCASYSAPHKESINRQARQSDFTIKEIELSVKNRNIIPSTPAILILGNKGELVYLGPYGEGIECSIESSIVDIILKNYIKGFNANLIINKAKGCYCHL
ncbi:hypothetical protein GCM10009111_32550 [Colwellia asteriadis]|uniref:DUF6436 domain-containing protein n=1 Tax=Colwellia asteriadis TaxID=517723 RepID=A0ABN1LB62_9GAMM